MAQITDLNVLFGENEIVKLTTKDGENIEITIEVSTGLALYVTKLREEKELTEKELEVLTIKYLLNEQMNLDVTENWIVEQIPWKFILYISKIIIESRGSGGATKKK